MKIDIVILPSGDFQVDAERIIQARAWGFAAAWSAEWLCNPFFPLTIAAKCARSPFTLGTLAAQAIARSPMVSAQIAWDLTRQSGGRFVLGLDADRPGFLPSAADNNLPASAPGSAEETIGKIREYIDSLRAIWRTFQHDERLRFRGRHYQFRLMAPFFNPGPIADPDIPIFLSGDDSEVFALAGELCQGLHVNMLHSQSYLRDVVLPHLSRGLASAGRTRETFELAIPVLVLPPDMPDLLARAPEAHFDSSRKIIRYIFTRRHQAFAAYHGCADILASLRARALAGDSAATPHRLWRSFPPEILHEFAIMAEARPAAVAIRQRYRALADRVCIVVAEWDPEYIAALAAALQKQPLG